MLCLLLLAANLGCGSDLYAGDTEAAGAAASKTFSVTAYGAKGDGVNDDGPAIQRALNAAATIGGGAVTFPCGQFALLSVAGAAPAGRSVLYVKGANGVQVSGQMSGQSSCTHVFTALPQKSVFEFDASTQISFRNLRITALNAPYVETYGMDGGSAIRLTGVTGGSIQSVEVDGASAGALYLTAGTSGISVTQNNLHDTYGAGIWEDDCGAASATSCAPSRPPSNNTYSSNTFTDVSLDGGGAMSVDDGNGISNAVIRNNAISWTRPPVAGNPGVHCIGVNNASNVSVLNNSCTATPWDAIVITTGVTGTSIGVVIQGNTIVNSGTGQNSGSGIVVYDAPQGLGISNFSITGNTITNSGQDGIRLYAASKPGNVQLGQVVGNTVTLADQHSPGSHFGIDIEFSSHIQVNSNAITCTPACTAAGVRIYSSASTSPTAAANQVSNILGLPLVIQ